MDVTLPIFSILLIAIDSVGIAISLYIGFALLFQKNKNHISVNLLGVLLILVGITLLNDLLVTSGFSNRLPWLYFTPIFYSLSIGPLFFLFIKSKFNLGLKKSDYLHLIIPAIQALVYFSIGFRSTEFKNYLWEESNFPLYLQIESFLFPVFLFIYSIASLMILKNRNENIYFWSNDLRNWLIQFSVGMFLIATLELGFSILEYLLIPIKVMGINIVLFHSLTLSIFTFWIAINGFKQYLPLKLYSSSPNKLLKISDKDFNLVKEQIKNLMEIDRIYLNPDLNLKLLANYLNISEKVCSYFLNQEMNSSFNTIVNEYRIEEFKKRIRQRYFDKYTLTSIAYDCGFNSKSTFNRVFKSECGITPSEYLKIVAQ